MKNKTLLLALCMLAAATTLHAQDTLSVKQQASAPYKLAVGARFSSLGPLGADLSLSAKYFIGKESALEAQATAVPGSDFFQASLNYIWQPQLLSSSQFRPYVGVGVGFIRIDFSRFEDGEKFINPVGVFTIGAEYSFKKLPIAVSVDYRNPFLRYNNSSTQSKFTSGYYGNIGLGIKYILK